MLKVIKGFLMLTGFLTILSVTGIFVLFYKMDNDFKKMEPEFRQYLEMTVVEQNAYVEKNMNHLYREYILNYATEQQKADFEKLNKTPEVRIAAINWGRSVIANLILFSKPITKDLSVEAMAQLQAEANQRSSRADKYKKLLEKYDTKF